MPKTQQLVMEDLQNPMCNIQYAMPTTQRNAVQHPQNQFSHKPSGVSLDSHPSNARYGYPGASESAAKASQSAARAPDNARERLESAGRRPRHCVMSRAPEGAPKAPRDEKVHQNFLFQPSNAHATIGGPGPRLFTSAGYSDGKDTQSLKAYQALSFLLLTCQSPRADWASAGSA